MSSTTLLPFLYQTRTLASAGRTASLLRLAQNVHPGSRDSSLPSSRRYVSARPLQTGPTRENVGEDIPFEYLQHTPMPPKPSKKDLATTTLTPTERQAFEAIFADIERSGLRPVVPFTEDVPPDGDIGFESEAIPDKQGDHMTHSLRAILDHAGMQFNSRNAATFEPLSPLQQLQTPTTDRGKLVMKYPSPLRATAHKALHFLDQDPAGARPTKPTGTVTSEMEQVANFERALRLEEQRREERTKVESLMKAAPSDVELWNIMEANVFSMIAKMHLADHQIQDKLTDAIKGKPYASPTDSSTGSTKKRGRRAKKAKEQLARMAKAEPDKNGLDPNDRKGAMSIRIHGPLYPQYIQLGLNLLDSHFARSSPLALSLLPRIKELGLASYVLGVSMPFYNNLMEIYWSRYGDVAAVLKLLEEVRITGLYMDEQTLNLLHHMKLRLQAYSERSSRPSATKQAGFAVGAFARHMSNLPEYDAFIRERVGYWIKKVHQSIEERQETLGF